MGALHASGEGGEPQIAASDTRDGAPRHVPKGAQGRSSVLAVRNSATRHARRSLARGSAISFFAVLTAMSTAGCSTSSQSVRPRPTAAPHAHATEPANAPASPIPSGTTQSTMPSTIGSSEQSTREIHNLQPSADLDTELIAAYSRARGLNPGVVVGIAPTKLLYAYDGLDETYWADAVFLYSPNASQQDQLRAQDGGDEGLFSKTAGGAWNATIGSSPSSCARRRFFPPQVISYWHLPVLPNSTC